MTLQWVGPTLAIATVVSIALGHILVRRLHARYNTRSALPLLVIGLTLLTGTLWLESDFWAALLGVLGVTCFWDGIEIFRQERRMQRESES